MDILRNIEKKLLTILSDKDKLDISKINILKGDIRLYVDNINKKKQIIYDKNNKYIELYHNKRLDNDEQYNRYLIDKKNLMDELIKYKNKGVLNNFLNKKIDYPAIPEIYTYENISLEQRIVTPKILKQTTEPSKKQIPKVKNENIDKECPEGKEINPVTKRCVKICDKDKIRNPKTGKCEKPIKPIKPEKPEKPEKPKKSEKPEKSEKECPEGKEINPVTKRCVKICDKDKVRNPKTGKCEKIKK